MRTSISRACVFAFVALLALGFGFASPARAGHDVKIFAQMHAGEADRTWVTFYRSEFSGMQRTIVASGWMSPRRAFSASVYNTYHYFIRAQVHRGETIVGDTTTEVDPRHRTTVTLVQSGGNHFYWQ